jgi:hypothetical protein
MHVSISYPRKQCCGAGARGAVIKLPPEVEAVIVNYGSVSGSLLFCQRLEEI